LWGSIGAGTEGPPGEADKGALRLDFDRCLMLQFCGSAITTDAGLLAHRESDDTLELTDKSAGTLAEARTWKKSSPSVDRFGRAAGART
jgi:hypothetical protein